MLPLAAITVESRVACIIHHPKQSTIPLTRISAVQEVKFYLRRFKNKPLSTYTVSQQQTVSGKPYGHQ